LCLYCQCVVVHIRILYNQLVGPTRDALRILTPESIPTLPVLVRVFLCWHEHSQN